MLTLIADIKLAGPEGVEPSLAVLEAATFHNVGPIMAMIAKPQRLERGCLDHFRCVGVQFNVAEPRNLAKMVVMAGI